MICHKTKPNQTKPNHIYLIYMYKGDLALCIKKIQHQMTYNGWYAIKPTKLNHKYLIYMYKEELALNNLQWLICHKTQPNQIIHI